MEELQLLVLGGALTLLGSVVVQMIQASSQKNQWRLERDERRLQQAATDLARLRVFIDEYNPRSLALWVNPDDPFSEGNSWVERWRAIRPDVTRIGVLRPELDTTVLALVEAVLHMIQETHRVVHEVAAGGDLSDYKLDLELYEAGQAQRRASEYLRELADAING